MSAAPFDTFDRPAGPLGTAPTGQTWTLRPWAPFDTAGDPIAQSTSVLALDGLGFAVSPDDDHAQLATLTHDSGDADLVVKARSFGAVALGTGWGCVFRWQSPVEWWAAFDYRGTGLSPNDRWGLFVVKHEVTGRSVVFSEASTHSAARELRVVLEGPSIEVYKDGVLTASITDSDYAAANEHGIVTYFSAEALIDQFGERRHLGWRVGSIGIG